MRAAAIVIVAALHLYKIAEAGPCEDSITCQNNAKCENIGADNFKCNCNPPNVYTGQFCEVDPCVRANNICKNGATCAVDVKANKGTCDCTKATPADEWQGPQCDVRREGNCKSVTCSNGGICKLDSKASNGVICVCPDGFSGQYCEIVKPSTTTLTQTLPAASTVLTGSLIQLTCATSLTFTGTAIFTLFRESAQIDIVSVSTKSHIFSTNVPKGTWKYKCTAQVTVGGTASKKTSTEVVVKGVDTPKKAEIKLKTQNPSQGDEIVLECSYSGSNRYAFKKENVVVQSFNPSPTFIIKAADNTVIGKDLAKYTCIAYVDVITVSSIESEALSLTVLPKKPTLTRTPSGEPLQVQTDVKFNCKTTSTGTKVFTLHENKDLTTVLTSATDITADNGDMDTTNSMEVVGSKKYSCRVKINDVLSVHSDEIALTFVEKPSKPVLVIQPLNPTIGEKATLSCNSDSKDVNKYEFKKGADVKRAAESSKTYEIAAVAAADVGSYMCVAYKDDLASDDSDVVKLIGQVKTPVLTVTTFKSQYDPNEQVTLQCKSDTVVDIIYKFYKDGVPLVGPNKVISDGSGYSIKITLKHSGLARYTCTATLHGGATSPKSNPKDLYVLKSGTACQYLKCNSKNKGYCKLDAKGVAACVCLDDAEGKYCTHEIDENPNSKAGRIKCQNGATASKSEVAPYFKCTCKPGFMGQFCETKRPEKGKACAKTDDCNLLMCDDNEEGYCHYQTFKCQCKKKTDDPIHCAGHSVCNIMCPSSFGLCLKNGQCKCFKDNNQMQLFMTTSDYPNNPPFFSL